VLGGPGGEGFEVVEDVWRFLRKGVETREGSERLNFYCRLGVLSVVSSMRGEPPKPLILTADEAAKLLGICRRTLSKKSADGQIPHFKIGKIVRFHLSELRTYIERSEGGVQNRDP